MNINQVLFYLVALLLTISSLCDAAVERRKDQFGRDFGYYLYPIVGEIPGLGSAVGGGASVLNLGGNDADITGYYVRGDFEARGVAMLDYHLLPQRLIFDVGYNDYLVAATAYDRGIDSDPDDVIRPKAEGNYLLGQITYTMDQRRYEVFARALGGRNRLLEVLDKEGEAFAGVDTEWDRGTHYAFGGSADLTDDRLDPRDGGRFEFAANFPDNDAADASKYFVTDYNFSYYLPMRRTDTLAFNLFHSRAHVTRKGETEYTTLQQAHGLDCDQYTFGTEYENCRATEDKHLNSLIAHNRYGTASSLGGTQRLRSFDNGRFYASQALFYGAEYRWNLTDERTPFDIFIAKGIRTGLQLAAFWEHGMVTDDSSDLFNKGRNSYGIGFRVILSGVIIRLDLAYGTDGIQSQLFITYPWSMFSVDNPG